MLGRVRKLAEVAVIFLLLAVIAGTMAYGLAGRGGFASAASCEQKIAKINLAVEKWFFDKSRWPADDLSDIAADPRYFPHGLPRCPVTGEPYRLDPHSHRVIHHRH